MAIKGTKFVLDTSAYSGFNRGDKRLKRFFIPENQLLLPLIVVAELRAGFSLGSKRAENESLLQRFLDSPSVGTVTITETTTKLFAEIFMHLKSAGTPINTNDIWIAALTFEHDCMLVTLDSDFKQVPKLSVAAL